MTYLHPDHLGTPKYGTNAGGTQVWAWAPDAFGGGSPSGAATVNLRMPGQFYDAESSLFYNWNRYYNPATGRYISSDPIGLEGGINTFLYAAASPVMRIDLLGLQGTAFPVPQGPLGEMIDPHNMNQLPPSAYELQNIYDTLAIITGPDQNAILALNPHLYKNVPDLNTGAMLPPCAQYAAFDVVPVTAPRNKPRIIIGTGQSIWYTNNHYRSFYQIVVPQTLNITPPTP